MNNNYVKCPCCDLNYIQAREKHCKVCDPKKQSKLISTAEAEYEEYREAKWEAYKAHKQSMEAYRAIRWNRKARY